MMHADGQTTMDRTSTGAAEAPEYQSLSPLAALAFVLGLLSPAALATPMLLVVPAAAAGVALLALTKIRASDGTLTGAGLARCGLAIALASAVAPLIRDPIRDALMHRQTAEVARSWLTLLAEDRTSDSRVLLSGQALSSLGPGQPKPGEQPPAAEVVETVTLENLRNDKLARRLSGFKTPLTVTVESGSLSPPMFDGGRTMTAGVFVVAPAGAGESCRVQLNFVRAAYFESEGRPWRIDRWSLVDEPAASAGSNPT